jgi:hypothetical protein
LNNKKKGSETQAERHFLKRERKKNVIKMKWEDYEHPFPSVLLETAVKPILLISPHILIQINNNNNANKT